MGATRGQFNIVEIRVLTNSTLKSRRSCAERLTAYGFTIFDEEVITASYATAVFLRELAPRSCWVMLERERLDEFKGIQQDLENPEYVVVGDNRSRINFEYLNRALRLLRGGAKLIGMQSELTDTSMGGLELNVGSWVGMLERASGVRAIYIGKPSPYGFDLTMKTMGLGRDEVAMVGDKISTDVAGAKAYGIRAILVRTGECDEEELGRGCEPDFSIDSVCGVLEIMGGTKEHHIPFAVNGRPAQGAMRTERWSPSRQVLAGLWSSAWCC